MRWAESGQREVVFPKKKDWGGKRKGAGRKASGRPGVRHVRREAFDGTRNPVLVTLRVRPEIGSLRREDLREVIFEAIRLSNGRGIVGVTDFSILSNHLHLIVEAIDEKALSRGMQGLKIRIAKAINRALGRTEGGTVFADRYHSRVLGSPTEVRNGLLYVVNNMRKHLGERRMSTANDWIDPFSSGAWFDGWRSPPPEALEARPTSSPRTWVRREGWLRAGPPFRRYEHPGLEPEP